MNDNNKTLVLDTPDQIRAFRLITLWSGLKLESKGIKVSRGISCRKIVKEEFGIKFRDIQKVIAAYEDIIVGMGVLDESKRSVKKEQAQ
jgi:hypothetical protein